MKAISLQTNYRTNPLGIDDNAPLFRWKCEGGTKQDAYRVVAREESGKVVFDSGIVESHRMRCRYAGRPLKSMERILWQVTLWEGGAEETSGEAFFEMGLLEDKDRIAQWICGIGTNKKHRLPPDCYRKVFSLEKPIAKARLYATACGVYKAVLNGKRLPGVLAPGTTEYSHRLYYQVYDVTPYLGKENTLDITVGDGWYKGKLGWLEQTCRFGKQLKLWAQLVITYTDGTRETIGTDESWRWCNDGPIRYADLMDGEVYDARMVPSYAHNAQLTTHNVVPTAAPADGIEEHETFKPELIITPGGAKILDFGQNLAGYVRFQARGAAGQTVTLKLFECLDGGEFSDMTLRKDPAKPADNQKIVYTCSGVEDTFQSDFFYSGFRYALVEGLEAVDPEAFEAVAVYSRLDFVGDFQCSNERINQFLRNTRWSLKSNFVDIPTDCPQREKSGWDGDAQVFIGTASYFVDTMAFFRKWLRDLRDTQRKDGRVENVSPSAHRFNHKEGLGGSVGWADAAVIVPYTLWKRYGDDAVIRENLDLMLGWADYVKKAAADKRMKHLPMPRPFRDLYKPYYVSKSPLEKYVIESGMHWGEWLEPDIDSTKEQSRPKPELTAAYTHYSIGLLAEMLRSIGRNKEAADCDAFAQGAKQAYNYYFVKDGKIQAPRQAPMVRALALGLLSEEDAIKAAADLNQNAIDRNYTVGTGFLSTPFVLGVLSKYGYVDTAYKMLENTKAPGWLAMVEQGATTVWEVYHIFDEKGHPKASSMNHYSPGAVCGFLFDTVCGIQIAGENHFRIVPIPGGTLTHAAARYDSPYGLVESKWKKREDHTTYVITIPANCTAEVILPGGTCKRVTAGRHEMEEAYV